MKNQKSESTKSGGIGFVGLLTIASIVLKLVGVISWPWIWILAPVWVPILIIIIVFTVVCIFAIKDRKRV